jgi:hypothetical protein
MTDAFTDIVGAERGAKARPAQRTSQLQAFIDDHDIHGLLTQNPESWALELAVREFCGYIQDKALLVLARLTEKFNIHTPYAQTISMFEGVLHLHPPVNAVHHDPTQVYTTPICMARSSKRATDKFVSVKLGEWQRGQYQLCPACCQHAPQFPETQTQEGYPLPLLWHTLALEGCYQTVLNQVKAWQTDGFITLHGRTPWVEEKDVKFLFKTPDGEATRYTRGNLVRLWLSEYLETVIKYLRSGRDVIVIDSFYRDDYQQQQALQAQYSQPLHHLVDVAWRELLRFWSYSQSKGKLHNSKAWAKNMPRIFEACDNGEDIHEVIKEITGER